MTNDLLYQDVNLKLRNLCPMYTSKHVPWQYYPDVLMVLRLQKLHTQDSRSVICIMGHPKSWVGRLEIRSYTRVNTDTRVQIETEYSFLLRHKPTEGHNWPDPNTGGRGTTTCLVVRKYRRISYHIWRRNRLDGNYPCTQLRYRDDTYRVTTCTFTYTEKSS